MEPRESRIKISDETSVPGNNRFRRIRPDSAPFYTGADTSQDDLSAKEQIFSSLKRYPLLSKPQEQLIFKARRDGLSLDDIANDPIFKFPDDLEKDERFRNAIEDSVTIDDLVIICNLRLVIAAATKRKGVELEDAFQEGIIGLKRAVELFDYSRDLKFSTYAVRWINQAMGRSFHNNSRAIRLPVHLSEVVLNAARFREVFYSNNGREPTEEEIIANLVSDGKSEPVAKRAARQLLLSQDTLSLDVDYTGDDRTLKSKLHDNSVEDEDQIVDRLYYQETLGKALGVLDERSARVIRLRYGLENERMTLNEVAEVLKVSRETVRYIEKKAMKKMRGLLGIEIN